MNPPKAKPGEPRSLAFYLLYAVGMHVVLLVLAGFNKKPEAAVTPETPIEVTLEAPKEEAPPAKIEPPPVEKPVEKPVEAAPPEKSEPRPIEKFVTREVVPEKQPEASIADELATIDEPSSADNKPSWVPQVNPRKGTIKGEAVAEVKPPPKFDQVFSKQGTRKMGSIGRRDTAAGTGNGPVGAGIVWGRPNTGLPIVSGMGVFGSGKKGALKGTLCFVPTDTNSLASVRRCVAEGIMYTNSLNISKRRFTSGFPGVNEHFEWFALDYNGSFSVKKAGNYIFRILSDDGSLVWVDGKFLINNDGLHSVASKTAAIELAEGKHKIRVFYFQGPRVDIALQLFVTVPGEAEKLWGPEL